MQKKGFVLAVLFAFGCVFGGMASQAAEEPETLTETYAHSDRQENERAGKEVHVQEDLMENMSVDASMYVPEGKFTSYKTRLKVFERDEISGLFWPEAVEDEIQETDLDGGGFSLTYQGESLGTSHALLRYFKDDNISYILELLAFGEWEGLLQEKDLDFMPLSQAKEEAETLLSCLRIGGDPVLSEAFGVSADELADLYEAMKEDESYRWFFDSGRLADYVFGEKDEGYYLEYTFALDGIPVYGPDSATLRINGGIDTPLPAYQCSASCFITSSGFRHFTLSGAVDGQMEKEEEQELLSYEGVRMAIEKEYGDVILPDEYRLSEIWAEYLPLLDIKTGSEIDLIPVWCCRFELKLNGEEAFREVDLTNRFHAFTGEEVP